MASPPSTPRAEMIHFEATDGLRLSGLLFEPKRHGSTAMIFLHGNGDSSIFTSSRTARFAHELTRRGIAWLPFDNRGANLVKRMRKREGTETIPVDGGMTFELIRDCVHDIDGALRFLRSRGYSRLFIAGHSTGANKVCLYNAIKPRNRAAGYILLAPGDDVGIYYKALGRKRFFSTLDRCHREIERGHGDRFAPRSISPFLISWSSLLDTIDPDGDYNVFPFNEAMQDLRLSSKPLFEEYRTVRKPSLVIYGSEDEYCFGNVEGCVALLERHASPRRRFRFEILPDTDHGFHGKQAEVGRLMAEWVRAL